MQRQCIISDKMVQPWAILVQAPGAWPIYFPAPPLIIDFPAPPPQRGLEKNSEATSFVPAILFFSSSARPQGDWKKIEGLEKIVPSLFSFQSFYFCPVPHRAGTGNKIEGLGNNSAPCSCQVGATWAGQPRLNPRRLLVLWAPGEPGALS